MNFMGTSMQSARAIDILERQRQAIEPLKEAKSSAPEFTKWRRDTEIALERVFDPGSRNIGDFKKIKYSLSFVGRGTTSEELHRAYVKGLAQADAVLQSMIDEVREYSTDASDETAYAPDTLSLVERICLRFHSAARALQDRHDDRETIQINDEYDVQDLLHAFLRLHFDDIRLEESGPSHAGSSPRMDFLLKDERIVVEVKKTRPTLNAKKLGEELIIDCARYERHPDCDTLVCFVYDPEGRIGNPTGMERDLESHAGRLKVRVIIAPK